METDAQLMHSRSTPLPLVDLSPFVAGGGDRRSTGAALRQAAREFGFFYCTGHGVRPQLLERLQRQAALFFAQDLETKLEIAMARGGRAWRGYFPVGQELTSGRPDQKEGLYFGAELPAEHPKVRAGLPLHGANLFPELSGFRATVLEYIEALTHVGHRLMEVVALSLGLDSHYFHERYTRDPLVLFRIFHYPPVTGDVPSDRSADAWGVGEHTDYGLLTILAQDPVGGLEVRTRDGWVDAAPLPGAFVCNLGDMLERMTGGFYCSTPHRVRSESQHGRLSFPFFFDPAFDAAIQPIELDLIDDAARDGGTRAEDRGERWDGASVHDLTGTYGEYLLGKVSKVFPELGGEML